MSSAEQSFRKAFERLKQGVPDLLPRSAPVSQNNVAKEAGCDPSALRKSRYPSLVAEIQRWVAEHQDEPQLSERQKVLAHRRRNRSLRDQLESFKVERDHALSLLVEADATIVYQAREIECLKGRLNSLLPAATAMDIFSRVDKEK